MNDHARMSDPVSSDIAVKAIVANTRLADQIMAAARSFNPVAFDDTDLLFVVEEATGRRQQRNVIARARGRLEQLGELERIGLRDRGDRFTLHFTITKPAPVPVRHDNPCRYSPTGGHNYDRLLFGGGVACTHCDEIEPEDHGS